jgi:hypothetical protein
MVSGGLQLDAQCYPDRHNTTWYDGWISCEASDNPNPVREKSHWIFYNLGYTYHLGQMHVWNNNAPDFLKDGIQTALIDVSVDGINWTEVGEFEFEQAPGKSTYEGFSGPDLTGYEAKYLLITAQSNWGGTCYGLSEIRVDVSGVTNVPELAASNDCLEVKAFPNPASERSAISVIAGCSQEDIRFVLLDITGRVVVDGSVEGSHGLFQFDLQLDQFQPGTYLLTVEQEGIQHREKIVKIR